MVDSMMCRCTWLCEQSSQCREDASWTPESSRNCRWGWGILWPTHSVVELAVMS